MAYEIDAPGPGYFNYFYLKVNFDTSTGDPTSAEILKTTSVPTDAADPGNGNFPTYLHFQLGYALGNNIPGFPEWENVIFNSGGGNFNFTSVASDLVVGASNNYIRKKLYYIRS